MFHLIVPNITLNNKIINYCNLQLPQIIFHIFIYDHNFKAVNLVTIIIIIYVYLEFVKFPGIT